MQITSIHQRRSSESWNPVRKLPERSAATTTWIPACAGITAVAGLLLHNATLAQPYPSKAIRIIAPFPPASVADVLARPIAPKMSETFGQPVIVDNRTGAGGNVGADLVAKSPPDGYTLLLGTVGTNAINATLYSKMPYNARTDFAAVTLVANAYLILVMHPSVPVRTVKEVINIAKASPGKLNFGSAGAGTTPHLAGEMFQYYAKVKMTHVAYKGSPQSTIDLMAGRIDLIFANPATSLPHIRNGKLRIIAITAPRRDPAMPDLPAIAETVPQFDLAPWWALFAPAGTTRDVLARLNTESVRILSLPEIKAHYANLGMASIPSTLEQAHTYVQDEIARWAKIIKATGARAD